MKHLCVVGHSNKGLVESYTDNLIDSWSSGVPLAGLKLDSVLQSRCSILSSVLLLFLPFSPHEPHEPHENHLLFSYRPIFLQHKTDPSHILTWFLRSFSIKLYFSADQRDPFWSCLFCCWTHIAPCPSAGLSHICLLCMPHCLKFPSSSWFFLQNSSLLGYLPCSLRFRWCFPPPLTTVMHYFWLGERNWVFLSWIVTNFVSPSILREFRWAGWLPSVI